MPRSGCVLSCPYDGRPRREVTQAWCYLSGARRVLSVIPGRTVTGEEQLAAEFEAHRPYLRAIASRTLGSHADADDAVQEAWLRLARAGRAGLEDLRAWLTT